MTAVLEPAVLEPATAQPATVRPATAQPTTVQAAAPDADTDVIEAWLLGGSPARPAPQYAGIDDKLAAARSRLHRLTPREAFQKALHGRIVLIDIRPEAQRREQGEIDPLLEPLVIERNVLEWRLDPRNDARLPIADPELRVVVICQQGYTSSLAADSLARIGVRHATDVEGGFEQWRSAGLPVTAGAAVTS